MAPVRGSQARGAVDGVSLASYMQMLEQERKSCTLNVISADNEGFFYFHEGQLIDAQCFGASGLAAAYEILSWENPQFSISGKEDRIHKIIQPLTQILLKAATFKDEANETASKKGSVMAKAAVDPAIQDNPKILRLVEKLSAIPGVRHYYLLSRQGKMITQSSKNRKIGDFIAYSLVSGIQMRQALETKALYRIRIMLADGCMLLIIPGGGMIIGLMLEENTSETSVVSRLRQMFAKEK